MFSRGGREARVAALEWDRANYVVNIDSTRFLRSQLGVSPIIDNDIQLPYCLLHGPPVLMMVRLKGWMAFFDDSVVQCRDEGLSRRLPLLREVGEFIPYTPRHISLA